MSQKQKVAIKSDVLKKELEKRGLSNPEVSAAMGYKDKGYMAGALREGEIAFQGVILLEQLYRIDPDLYLVKEEPEEVEEPLEGQICMEGLDVPLVPAEKMAELIRWSVTQLCQAIEKSTSELAGPMKRIAAALEENEDPQVLPWGPLEITDEEVGGPF